MRLGVNIDHVATIRQARGTQYPDPIEAAKIAARAGADGITLHLREDRRHIQDADVYRMSEEVSLPINFECAATDEMVKIACDVKPAHVCLVPEKREELTTEGGLDVISNKAHLRSVCNTLADAGITVSIFIDPDEDQIAKASEIGAPVIEIHTGRFADAQGAEQASDELSRIVRTATYAKGLGLQVNAGHGLHYENVTPIARIPELTELNIGHSIVAQAIMEGFEVAVRRMRELIDNANKELV